MTATVGSLFAGVGGFDLGMEQAGFTVLWQAEWDKHCQSILRRHWPDCALYGDVTDVNGGEIPPVDVITFGSPCQDLSVAGKRAGLDGDRSSMFFQAIRIIKEMRDATDGAFPAVAVWENVPGSLSSNKGADFGVVLDALADVGAVAIEWAVLDARWFGVPQRRRRVFVVAVFDPVIAERCPDPLLPLGEIAHRDCDADQTVAFYRTHGRQDQPQVGVAPPLKVVSPVCIASSSTVPRILTPSEHERLMGWPDDHTRWTDDGREQADSHRYRQCGNGVATPVAAWIGSHLLPLLEP